MTRRPSIGPRDEIFVRGPDTVYRWLSLETAGPDATVHLRTVDGLDWTADRPPLPEEPELPRRVDRQARDAYVEEGRLPESLAAARVGIEHVEHHGLPLRFVGSSYVGDVAEHRFACTDRTCRFVLTWSATL